MEPSDGFYSPTQDSAMALPGIANENEFYSAHYLDAILKEDLKDVAKRWKAEAVAEDDGSDDSDGTAGKSPDQALGSLRQARRMRNRNRSASRSRKGKNSGPSCRR